MRSNMSQCVVARLWSSRPAAASRNAPLHTDAVRRVLVDARRSHCTSGADWSSTTSMCGEPGTMSVSTVAARHWRNATVCRSSPSALRTWPPAGLAVMRS